MAQKIKPASFEILLLVFSAIIFLDRVLKLFVQDSCLAFLCIKRTANSGAAFGILSGQFWLLMAVSVIVLALIAYFWRIKEIRLALTLLAAGTIGNLIDRILYSRILDIFSVFGSSSFNLSDLSNLAGAILLIIFILKGKSK